MRRPYHIGLALLLPILPAFLGCDGQTRSERFRQLDRQVRDLTDQVQALQDELAAKKAVLEAKDKQIATLRRIGDKRFEMLFHVTDVEIERLSGGADYDGQPGHDGVTVYLQPLDQDGHVIKAAGDIRVQLLDLANPDGQHLIGEYRLGVDKAREAWHGKLMTNHYTLKCPWPKQTGPPAHPEITVRVEFTDYLTGRTFRDQRVVEVTLP